MLPVTSWYCGGGGGGACECVSQNLSLSFYINCISIINIRVGLKLIVVIFTFQLNNHVSEQSAAPSSGSGKRCFLKKGAGIARYGPMSRTKQRKSAGEAAKKVVAPPSNSDTRKLTSTPVKGLDNQVLQTLPSNILISFTFYHLDECLMFNLDLNFEFIAGQKVQPQFRISIIYYLYQCHNRNPLTRRRLEDSQLVLISST